MSRVTRRIPEAVKQLAPVVRERDALRQEVLRLRAVVAARSEPTSPAAGTYVGRDRVLIATGPDTHLVLPSDELHLLKEFLAHGGRNFPLTGYGKRYLQPGDVVFDVAAGFGHVAISLATQVAPQGRVLAYETDPRALEFLHQNIELNDLEDRVDVVTELDHAPERVALLRVGPGHGGVLAGLDGPLTAGAIERLVVEPAALDDAVHARLQQLVELGWTCATLTDEGEPVGSPLDSARQSAAPLLLTRPAPAPISRPAATPATGRAPFEFPSGWDDWHRRRLISERHFVPWVERVMPLAGRTVLEYGAGNGPVTAAFAPHAGRYIGVDIDEADLDVSRRILREANLHPELHAAPPSEIVDLTATFRGEVDVFLFAAVLEHMSGEERLALLRLAREVVRPDGIIVVFETPNRLTPWDYHTTQLPFLNQLPEDVALAYLERSPRTSFVEAMRAAAAQGEAAEREAYVRWGRGMSFHEFELVFDDLPRHIVASSWDPLLLGDRRPHREELALQRVLDEARPDLPAAFSRCWLDLILTPSAQPRPGRFLRPWPLQTVGSTGATIDAAQRVVLDGPDATFAVALPVPSARLVLGSEGLAAPMTVRVRAAGEERTATLSPGPEPFAEVTFPVASASFEVRLDTPGVVSLVLYEA